MEFGVVLKYFHLYNEISWKWNPRLYMKIIYIAQIPCKYILIFSVTEVCLWPFVQGQVWDFPLGESYWHPQKFSLWNFSILNLENNRCSTWTSYILPKRNKFICPSQTVHSGIYKSLILNSSKLITQMDISGRMSKIKCGTFMQWSTPWQ